MTHSHSHSDLIQPPVLSLQKLAAIKTEQMQMLTRGSRDLERTVAVRRQRSQDFVRKQLLEPFQVRFG